LLAAGWTDGEMRVLLGCGKRHFRAFLRTTATFF
jgi:hypothetical protein